MRRLLEISPIPENWLVIWRTAMLLALCLIAFELQRGVREAKSLHDDMPALTSDIEDQLRNMDNRLESMETTLDSIDTDTSDLASR